jgi:diguanylate cyclase (GGDEF)-like protein/PAS domain S-box-containing protein
MNFDALSLCAAALAPALTQLLWRAGQTATIDGEILWEIFNLIGLMVLAALLWRSHQQGKTVAQQCQQAEQALHHAKTQIQRSEQLQKQAEGETELEHARFRCAILDAPLPIMIHAEDGEILLINQTWTDLTGYSLEDLPTIATWIEKACGDDPEVARAEIQQLYGLKHRSVGGESTVITQAGAVRTWDLHSAPLGSLPDGRRLVISTAFDLTDRRLMEDALQESEERLRLVLEAADCGTWYYDFATEKIIWSDRCRSMFGLTSGDGGFDLLDHVVCAEERARITQTLSKAITDGQPFNVEYPLPWQDGSIHWLTARGCAFYRDNGEPMRMLGIALDITAAKRDEAIRQQAEALLIQSKATLELQIAERTTELIQAIDRLQAELFATQLAEIELQESETRYRSVVNVLAEGIVLQDSQGTILTCNASAERILGLSIDQMTGRTSLDPYWQTIHEDGSPFPGEHHPAMVSLRTGEACLGVVMGIHQPDDRLTWISINSQPLFHPGETQPYAVVTSFTDITNLKRAEETLRTSEAELRALFAAITDIVLVRDKEGRCLRIAPTNPKNFYRPAEELLGKTLYETFPQPQAEVIQNWIQQALTAQQPLQREYCLTVQERDIHFSGVFSPLSADSVVIVARDITDRKQSEDQIRLLQQLTLAIGVSADFEAALSSVLQIVCETQAWNYGEAWIPSGLEAGASLKLSPAWFTTCPADDDRCLDPLQDFRAASLPLTFAYGLGMPGRAWRSQQSEWQEDATQAEYLFQRRELALQCGIKAGLSIPLIVHRQVLAVLVFFRLTAYPENPRLSQSLTTIGAQLGLVLQRKQAEEALFQEKELAQVTLRSIGDAVITTDEQGRVQYLNPIAETLIGWSQAEAEGLPISQVFHIVHETSGDPLPSPIESVLREGCTIGFAHDTVLVARDGTQTDISDSAAPIRNRDGQVIGAVMVFRDVSQARSLTKQLSWQARHDPLTGLPNRREFSACLEQAVHLAQTQEQFHTLGYLDLDRFKIVNDTCGHAAGDELLRQVTALLQSRIRKSDVLARLGGDEFAILLHHCPIPQAQAIAEALRERVHSFRFVWQQQQFSIGVSIGLVTIDAQSPDAVSVLKTADAACYRAKKEGRNRVYIADSHPTP